MVLISRFIVVALIGISLLLAYSLLERSAEKRRDEFAIKRLMGLRMRWLVLLLIEEVYFYVY
jgi:hypothetical protein